MASFVKFIFGIPVALRALLAAGAGYLLLELYKPGFAFASTSEGYVARPFSLLSSSDSTSYAGDDDEDTILPTSIPWWTIPVGLFGLFVLFV
jgi:hypothetical protein